MNTNGRIKKQTETPIKSKYENQSDGPKINKTRPNCNE